jgi:tRNA 2-thiouridine synthesizing protein A
MAARGIRIEWSPSAMATTAVDRLDVTGTLCPVPVLRTARRVRRLSPGALLEVVGDDPLMRLDLAAWCAKEGHEVVAMEEAGGAIRCVLRVGGSAP